MVRQEYQTGQCHAKMRLTSAAWYELRRVKEIDLSSMSYPQQELTRAPPMGDAEMGEVQVVEAVDDQLDDTHLAHEHPPLPDG